MLDHLLDGRFNLGISPGGLLSDAEAFGNLEANRNEMFLEAINQVLALWDDPDGGTGPAEGECCDPREGVARAPSPRKHEAVKF